MVGNEGSSNRGTHPRALQAVYHWTLRCAGTRHAVWALVAVCFLQSLVLPVPPDLLLIPMVLARRAKALLFATIATLSSTAGGLAGYAIGYFFHEAVGEPLLNLWGYEAKLDTFEAYRRQWGAWIVVAGALTPLPYKLVAVACGAARLDLGVFVLASLLSRGFRFYVEATLLWYFGPTVCGFIDRHLSAATAIGLVRVCSCCFASTRHRSLPTAGSNARQERNAHHSPLSRTWSSFLNACSMGSTVTPSMYSGLDPP